MEKVQRRLFSMSVTGIIIPTSDSLEPLNIHILTGGNHDISVERLQVSIFQGVISFMCQNASDDTANLKFRHLSNDMHYIERFFVGHKGLRSLHDWSFTSHVHQLSGLHITDNPWMRGIGVLAPTYRRNKVSGSGTDIK